MPEELQNEENIVDDSPVSGNEGLAEEPSEDSSVRIRDLEEQLASTTEEKLRLEGRTSQLEQWLTTGRDSSRHDVNQEDTQKAAADEFRQNTENWIKELLADGQQSPFTKERYSEIANKLVDAPEAGIQEWTDELVAVVTSRLLNSLTRYHVGNTPQLYHVVSQIVNRQLAENYNLAQERSTVTGQWEDFYERRFPHLSAYFSGLEEQGQEDFTQVAVSVADHVAKEMGGVKYDRETLVADLMRGGHQKDLDSYFNQVGERLERIWHVERKAPGAAAANGKGKAAAGNPKGAAGAPPTSRPGSPRSLAERLNEAEVDEDPIASMITAKEQFGI